MPVVGWRSFTRSGAWARRSRTRCRDAGRSGKRPAQAGVVARVAAELLEAGVGGGEAGLLGHRLLVEVLGEVAAEGAEGAGAALVDEDDVALALGGGERAHGAEVLFGGGLAGAAGEEEDGG